MRLTQVNVHPLKSTAPRARHSCQVQPRGLVNDRSWMVVDRAGEALTARECHRLFRIVSDTPTTAPGQRAALRLSAPGLLDPVLEDLLIDGPEGPTAEVSLFGRPLRATYAGPEADRWLTRALGVDGVRLVWCHDPSLRVLNPDYSQPGDHTAFADAYPVTLASEASLRRLNDLVTQTALERGEEPPSPLQMQRFRPNLVVDGEEPFAEDHWGRIEVGSVVFRVAKPTGRCVMTTVDPVTLDRGPEPIRTLAVHRRQPGRGGEPGSGNTLFAVSLIPELSAGAIGQVTVGDQVRALPAGPGR